MKKLAKYLRLLLILVGWTVFYLWIIGLIMNYFWHFNIFEKRYWLIISEFWSAGGVIDQPSEYMFLLMLVLIVPGWFWGFRKARQLSYVKIIFFPVFWYHDYICRPTVAYRAEKHGRRQNQKTNAAADDGRDDLQPDASGKRKKGSQLQQNPQQF